MVIIEEIVKILKSTQKKIKQIEGEEKLLQIDLIIAEKAMAYEKILEYAKKQSKKNKNN